MSSPINCPLAVTQRLFEAFEQASFQYVHWKSNEHLGAGLTGKTDLDILVNDGDTAESVLQSIGYKRFEPAPALQYPGICDYLGFDESTGTLVHVHLHERLILGHPMTKGHDLPWVNDLMQRRVRDNQYGVYQTDPAMELVLLLVRYALKLRTRDLVRQPVSTYLDEDIVAEFEWLQAQAEIDEIEHLVRTLLTEDAVALLPELLSSPPTAWQFRRFRQTISPALGNWKRLSPVEHQLDVLNRISFRGFSRLNEVTLHRPSWYRRVRSPEGLRIAIIGVDGAGKSTVTKELLDWLGWKLAVEHVYFGSGDGPSTLLRKPIKFARSFDTDRAPAIEDRNTEFSSSRPIHLRVGRILRGLVLARERWLKYRKAKRAASKGAIVVSDRYPQSQIEGFTDGPMLGHLAQAKPLLHRLYSAEQAVYSAIEANPPDLVIKLDLDPEVAADRVDDMPIEQLKRRREAMQKISFDTTVVTIDASRPLDDVVVAVKRAVWNHL